MARGATLALNDAFWTDNTEVALELATIATKTYGSPPASPDGRTLSGRKELLESVGLEVVATWRVRTPQTKRQSETSQLLAKLFRSLGNPFPRRRHLHFTCSSPAGQAERIASGRRKASLDVSQPTKSRPVRRSRIWSL